MMALPSEDNIEPIAQYADQIGLHGQQEAASLSLNPPIKDSNRDDVAEVRYELASLSHPQVPSEPIKKRSRLRMLAIVTGIYVRTQSPRKA